MKGHLVTADCSEVTNVFPALLESPSNQNYTVAAYSMLYREKFRSKSSGSSNLLKCCMSDDVKVSLALKPEYSSPDSPSLTGFINQYPFVSWACAGCQSL